MKNIKWIAGYEGHYKISEDGEVFSFTKGTPVQRSLQTLPTGYVQIGLWMGGKQKFHYVHRLVAQTFLNTPGGKCEVNHKNGIKTDNSVSNLEWVTPSENIAHAHKNGLKSRIQNRRLSDEQITNARADYASKQYTQADVARKYSISLTAMQLILSRKTFRAL